MSPRRAAIGLLACFAFAACSDSDSPTTPTDQTQPLAPPVENPAMPAVRGGFDVPVSAPGVITGTLKITSFAVKNGELVAHGIFNGETGDGTDVSNLRVRNIPVITEPDGVTVQQAVCPILHLDIGPIFVDLLGLQVSIDPIVVDITAVPGQGNLLGNLLCALVGLLDDTPLDVGLINSILAQINRILSQL